MGTLSELVRTIVHLCLVTIDVVILLLLFRMVGQWRRIAWVERINSTARGLVDPFITTVGRNWRTLTSVPLSPRRTLALSMLALWLARSAICVTAGLLLT